jgi:hypothetical protein
MHAALEIWVTRPGNDAYDSTMDAEDVLVVVKRISDRGDMAHFAAILVEMQSDDVEALEARLEALTIARKLQRLQLQWEWTGEPGKWTAGRPWWVPSH